MKEIIGRKRQARLLRAHSLIGSAALNIFSHRAARTRTRCVVLIRQVDRSYRLRASERSFCSRCRNASMDSKQRRQKIARMGAR